MKAIGVMTFGGPEVLHVVELPEPHAGAGEVRIRAHAASVNPTDTLFRAGSQAARLNVREIVREAQNSHGGRLTRVPTCAVFSGVCGWCRKRDSNPRPHHYE